MTFDEKTRFPPRSFSVFCLVFYDLFSVPVVFVRRRIMSCLEIFGGKHDLKRKLACLFPRHAVTRARARMHASERRGRQNKTKQNIGKGYRKGGRSIKSQKVLYCLWIWQYIVVGVVNIHYSRDNTISTCVRIAGRNIAANCITAPSARHA